MTQLQITVRRVTSEVLSTFDHDDMRNEGIVISLARFWTFSRHSKFWICGKESSDGI